MTTHYPISNGIFSELNRLVNQTLAPASVDRQDSQRSQHKRPTIEALSDDDEGVKLRLELPGFNKDEVKLSIDEGVLAIVAETEDEQRSFLNKQERRLKVSEEMDVENIAAKLENGILYLAIPHREKEEPKTIKVN
jgi:HSP20 family protein